MKITHIHSGKSQTIGYDYWKKEILDKSLEVNYNIVIKPTMVYVFEIDTETGKRNFIETTDFQTANKKYLEVSDKYAYVNAIESCFDNKLREIDNPNWEKKNKTQSPKYLFRIFLKIFKIIKATATLIKKPTVELIIAVLAIIIGYAIMKYYLHWI